MKLFLQFDESPIRHEYIPDAKWLSVVPEKELKFFDGEEDVAYQVYTIVLYMEEKKNYIIKHNVLSVEVI